MGVERAFFVIIAIMVCVLAVFVVNIAEWCSFFGFIPGTTIPIPVCGSPFFRTVFYYELFYSTPFKADLAVYTFLKTSTTKINVEDCIRYLDCVNESEETVCSKFYGSAYTKDDCEKLIEKTLSAVWESKAVLRFANYTFEVNKEKFDTVNPVYSTQRKLYIPFPAKILVVKFELW